MYKVIVTKLGQETKQFCAETVGGAVTQYGDYSGYLLTLDGETASREDRLTKDDQAIIIGEKCKGA